MEQATCSRGYWWQTRQHRMPSKNRVIVPQLQRLLYLHTPNVILQLAKQLNYGMVCLHNNRPTLTHQGTPILAFNILSDHTHFYKSQGVAKQILNWGGAVRHLKCGGSLLLPGRGCDDHQATAVIAGGAEDHIERWIPHQDHEQQAVQDRGVANLMAADRAMV